MPWAQAVSSVVIVAHQFNPTIFDRTWLLQRGILTEQDFQEGSIYTDLAVQVMSRQFHMLVLPEQLQFVPLGPEGSFQQLIVEKLGTILRDLPQTPYRALGLNFVWLLISADHNIARQTRELFFRADTPLYGHFDLDDAHFGGYLSKNIGGFRLGLDIKPILVPSGVGQENQLQFGFNFQADLAGNTPEQIQAHLRRWDELKIETGRIIDSIEPRQ